MSVLAFYKRYSIIFLQTPYLDTVINLSWVEPVMVKLFAGEREPGEIRKTIHISKVVISILIQLNMYSKHL